MWPGGEPTSRDTECFSMYSDMSIRTIASSSPKRNSASVRASSVLPTPDGPRKMNDPVGRFGSLMPARARRIDLETATIASFWPMTRLWSSSSMRTSRADSASVSLKTGMPVHMETMSAISSSPTTGCSSPADARQFSSSSRFFCDLAPVVRLVAVAQPAKDLDGVLDGRLVHADLLEAALERGIALQVLPVLVERRRTDGL